MLYTPKERQVKKKMKGVIYARYSSDNQREESIERQFRECKAFAEKNDIQIVETYIDRALSARTDRRPDFQRMIKDSSGKNLRTLLFGNLTALHGINTIQRTINESSKITA